jgi:hypothetical protein
VTEHKEPLWIQPMTATARACYSGRRSFLQDGMRVRSAHIRIASVHVAIVHVHPNACRELHDDGRARRGHRQLQHQLHERRRGDVVLLGLAELVLAILHPHEGGVEVGPDDPRQPLVGLRLVHL